MLPPPRLETTRRRAPWGSSYYGATTLDVDPGTLEALGSLGVTPGAVDPATLEGARYSFPIVNRLGNAVRTGVVRHIGRHLADRR